MEYLLLSSGYKMAVARQLYQLQEIDLEIESGEQALKRVLGRIGQNQVMVAAQNRLASEQRRLSGLTGQQRSVEGEIDDLVSKISAAEEQLYSGRIKNPKELSSLQHEVALLKAKRDNMENSALEIMGQVERAEADVSVARSEFEKLESGWHKEQKQLSADAEALKGKLSELKQRRQLLAAEIDPDALQVYDKLRKQKGQAVARVEQGICRGCRISLPFGDLQRVRSGNLIQCSSCGRILFLP